MLLTMTAYTGPEAFDRLFSLANCYFKDADMSKYCSYLLQLLISHIIISCRVDIEFKLVNFISNSHLSPWPI